MPIANSHKIIDGINEALFGAEQRRIQNWIDKLARENSRLQDRNPPLGFMHEGVFYRPTFLGAGRWPTLMLHDSLEEEARIFVKDRAQVENDKQFVSQTLFALISSADSTQALRDTLPECLIPLVPVTPALTQLDRWAEPACTIADNPRALKQYHKVLPTIETYTAARLIY